MQSLFVYRHIAVFADIASVHKNVIKWDYIFGDWVIKKFKKTNSKLAHITLFSATKTSKKTINYMHPSIML